MNTVLTNTEARRMQRPPQEQALATTAINRIMKLTGDVPDPVRHRNYLESLSPFQLEERLKTMEAQTGRVDFCKDKPAVEFWRQRDAAPHF